MAFQSQPIVTRRDVSVAATELETEDEGGEQGADKQARRKTRDAGEKERQRS